MVGWTHIFLSFNDTSSPQSLFNGTITKAHIPTTMALRAPSISYSFKSHPKSNEGERVPLPLLHTPISPLQLTNHLISLSSLPPHHHHGKLSASSLMETKLKGSPQHDKDDFYLNLGLAVRTLREDLPQIFTKELNYDIYREDVALVDPLNTFKGIENYKLIIRALRFHGRILFREIDLEVLRIWQISENMILVRWNLRGTPRVPWEAKGHFQGTSRYKLDRNGKIYEHRVDNFAFNFPQLKKPLTVLDLVAAPPLRPTPMFCLGREEEFSSSWVKFYRVVTDSVHQHQQAELRCQDGLAICPS
ncbi:hypothetical protein AKJ16_DCAP11753 [Drosera capensis]